jgi:hypothetical protein
MARLFTLAEANALLPKLRELLPQMQQTKGALDALREELAGMVRTASGNGGLAGASVALKQEEAQKLVDGLNALLEEVQGLGCEVKGVDEGLIDFRSERDGRLVYLCWKLGEERIGYWHELEAGFAGRQPL